MAERVDVDALLALAEPLFPGPDFVSDPERHWAFTEAASPSTVAALCHRVQELEAALERTVYGVRRLGYEPDAETAALLPATQPEARRDR